MRRTICLICATILAVSMVGIVAMASPAETYMGFEVARIRLNGQDVTPPSPAIIVNDRAYVPLRFVGEALGAKVDWDEQTHTVIIESRTTTTAAVTPSPTNQNYVVKDANGTALYSFEIKKVTNTSERNQFSEKTPAQVIRIDYSYKNIASKEEVYLSDISFKVVDSAGKIGYTYPNTPANYPQRIPAGVTCDAQMIFGLDNKSDTVKIHFYENMFGSVTATFEVPVK